MLDLREEGSSVGSSAVTAHATKERKLERIVRLHRHSHILGPSYDLRT